MQSGTSASKYCAANVVVFCFFCGFEDVCVYIRLSTTNVGRGPICDVLVNSVLSYQTMAVGIPSVDFARRTMKHGEGNAFEANEPEKHRVQAGWNLLQLCTWLPLGHRMDW